MELRYDMEYLFDNAVWLYYLEIPHFTLVEEPKVFKNNVRDIYSASPMLCIFFVLKLSYIQLYTLCLSYEYIILLSLKQILSVTLITTPSWDIQVVAYLKLMEVYGRENGGGVFLWLVSNIKVLVTASYVMGKCRTGVLVSIFCNQ